MLDANAKLGAGIFYGNLNQVGNYDQCLSIEESNSESPIKGQYCTVLVVPNKNATKEDNLPLDLVSIANYIGVKHISLLKRHINMVKITYGFCMPSSCSIESLRSLWKYFEFTFKPGFSLEFYDIMCEYKGKPVFYPHIDIYVFALFGIYFFCIFIATIFEAFFYDKDENGLFSYIVAFSLISNSKKLFSTKVGEDNISCINGLKVISMIWVILGHRFTVNALLPNINNFYLMEWQQKIESMTIIGASVSVDTFLTISGLLLSYIYLRYTEIKDIKINIISFYLLRLCRLIPPLLVTILICVSVLKYLSDGPMWPILTGKMALDCALTGWMNLIFINNLLEMDKQCLPQSWYLAVDSQLYFLFPIIFFSVAKNPKKTFLGIWILGAVSMMYTFFTTMFFDYGVLLLDLSYRNQVYQKTFTRMPVWLIGVTAGYLVFNFKDKKFKINKALNVFIWLITLLVLNLIVFSQIFFVKTEKNNFLNGLFNAFARPLWALGICWIIFACVTKNGGIVNTFLSLPIFNFVAKLTYTLYLIHLIIIWLIVGRRRHVDYFSNIRSIHEVFGDIAFSTLVAMVFSLLFESPMITLGKKIFKKYEEVLKTQEIHPLNIVYQYILYIFPVFVRTPNVKLEEKMD